MSAEPSDQDIGSKVNAKFAQAEKEFPGWQVFLAHAYLYLSRVIFTSGTKLKIDWLQVHCNSIASVLTPFGKKFNNRICDQVKLPMY